MGSFFSICVPTRNRPDTLLHCLKTLLHQDFDSYEVIVSDNSDIEESNEVRRIVNDLNNDKLKYFKTPSILSMTENYEFALNKAGGQYILCMGDDDGLVINCLQYVFDFIQTYGCKVVKSPGIFYYWKGSHLFPNSILSFPNVTPIVEVNSKSVLQKVANFEMAYFNLPMIYYSFVDRSIIDGVVSEKGNFFQDSTSIDMYSGFIIANTISSFHVCDKPFAIAGLSGKSNGESAFFKPENKITDEFVEKQGLMAQYDNHQVPFYPRLYLGKIILLELLRFKKNYCKDLIINAKNLMIEMVSTNPLFSETHELGKAQHFSKYSIYENDLKSIEEDFISKDVFYPNIGGTENIANKHTPIDPNLFSVDNVYDASILCNDIIESKVKMMPIKIKRSASPVQVTPPKRSLAIKVLSRLKRSGNVLIGRE